ncbi:MAG: sigma-54-dependent Fis family transcriptional regulator, partial [Proteobacteria bacterium]|nr:sigma-54-dependent Fis family transcriptional regulator [Pseudomonadota bacterium]
QQTLLCDNRRLRQQLDLTYGLKNLIGHDRQMLKIFELIESVADSTVTVLIQGDSGTGKSLAARVIHRLSARREKPFVEVASGALPESLLESELFGHVRGAFTGAVANKLGKFQAAQGGTIFLDEIGTASPALQIKLLHVLQEKRVEPIGSNKTDHIDVRIILATNLDLEAEVKAGRFREDLYHQLREFELQVPPLRDRSGDISKLADAILIKMSHRIHRHSITFSAEACEELATYAWPGNVRELENVIERAVILCRKHCIKAEDLALNRVDNGQEKSLSDLEQRFSLDQYFVSFVKKFQSDFNETELAKMLGISRKNLWEKRQRLEIPARK